jgi:hypothetical protein
MLCFPTATTSAWARSIALVGRRHSGRPLPARRLDGADRQVAKLARFTRFLGKATIAQQAVGCRGTIGEFAKPAKMKARCNWRRKLGAADSGERAGRGRCYPVGYLSGDTGDRVSLFLYKLCATPCLQTPRRLTIICLICPTASRCPPRHSLAHPPIAAALGVILHGNARLGEADEFGERRIQPA